MTGQQKQNFISAASWAALIRVAGFGAVVLFSVAPSAFAWGCDGHKVVAKIAYERLSREAKAAANALLAQLPFDPAVNHYCTSDGNLFVDVSTWADDIRKVRPETASWHYVNLPLGTTKYDAKYCPQKQSCVVEAIGKQLAILRDENATAADQSMALLFVIHFVGDLHQPLHDTSNNDRGGNCVPVTFYGTEPVESENESFRPNLHSVWDVELVTKAMNGKSVSDFAAFLEGEFGHETETWAKQQVDVAGWAVNGEKLAEKDVYGKLQRKISIAAPVELKVCSDDHGVGERMEKLHEVVDEGYERETRETLERQLAAAGVRLAALLNDVWK
jgi:hypothetical protein